MKKDEKWGYIDKTGKEIIPCEYDCTWSFSD
ncbi:MAG: WG repeat-containing protein [Candidatus Peribacteria bacterium]|nr:WG repeat-containing protein [Candidatus Peribacteria bacterium]